MRMIGFRPEEGVCFSIAKWEEIVSQISYEMNKYRNVRRQGEIDTKAVHLLLKEGCSKTIRS